MSPQVPGSHVSTLNSCPGYPCQTIVSGYTLQLPPPAWVLSKAQLREIQFKGGSLKGHTFQPFFQIHSPSQSEDRETSCLKDGCEEKRYLPGNDCEPGERQIPDSWNITFYRRWVRFLQVSLVLSPCLPALKDSRDSRRPLLRFL